MVFASVKVIFIGTLKLGQDLVLCTFSGNRIIFMREILMVLCSVYVWCAGLNIFSTVLGVYAALFFITRHFGNVSEFMSGQEVEGPDLFISL